MTEGEELVAIRALRSGTASGISADGGHRAVVLDLLVAPVGQVEPPTRQVNLVLDEEDVAAILVALITNGREAFGRDDMHRAVFERLVGADGFREVDGPSPDVDTG